jgi:hypothetical protein
MPIKLLWMSGVLAVATAVVSAQAPPQPVTPIPFTGPARIKLDLDRTIGQVDPLLFGNFAEHLGG